jgi:preprotein translocase subunit SecG
LNLKGKLNFRAHGDNNKYWLGINDARITKPNTEVKAIEITANSVELKSMIEVAFVDQEVYYIPKFPKAYTNIEKFTVKNSHLKEVHRDDLSQFANLKVLWLFHNDLEVIEADLFQSNLNLEEINLNNNKIWFIGENSFRNLMKLKSISLVNNLCITYGQTGNINLHNLNDNLNKNCNNYQTKQIYEIRESIKILKNKNESIEFKNQKEKMIDKNRGEIVYQNQNSSEGNNLKNSRHDNNSALFGETSFHQNVIIVIVVLSSVVIFLLITLVVTWMSNKKQLITLKNEFKTEMQNLSQPHQNTSVIRQQVVDESNDYEVPKYRDTYHQYEEIK